MSLEYEHMVEKEKERKISKKRKIVYLLIGLCILGFSIIGVILCSSYYIIMGGAY